MPPEHNKDFLLGIVFFGIAVSKAQSQEPNFDFISPNLNFGKPVVCDYNGVCQYLYQEDPQKADHLQRKLRSSGFTNSFDDPIWTHRNGQHGNQNLESPSMENEWARLKRSMYPLKRKTF